jgi:TRAP-type transport system periplasmic protein
MRKSMRAAALAIGVASLALPQAASAQISWDLASVFAPTSADGMAAQRFAELVEEKTGGAIKVTVHFAGALGYQCPQLLEVVQTGAVPLASICTTMLGGHDPMFLVSTLPFVMERAEDARIYRDTYLPYLRDSYGAYDQTVLYSYPNTPAGLWAPEAKLTPESLRGWRMRTFDINSLTTMTNAGAAAINLPWGDVVPGLATGTISGVLTASDAGFTSNFNDYLPYFIAVNAVIGIAEATINRDELDGLSPELRQAVIEAGEETTDYAFTRMVALVGETYDRMRAAGMTVVEEPPAELVEHLREAGRPVVEDWLVKTGNRGEAVMAAYREALAAAGAR